MNRRTFALLALLVLASLLAAPATAKQQNSEFALVGEARALEVALGDQGVTLGLALTQANSVPEVIGVGAGQCALLGDTSDPDDLPCSDENTVRTRYPGNTGDGDPSCSGSLPAPLSDLIDIKVACGSSQSNLKKGLPISSNEGKVAELTARVPLDSALLNTLLPGDGEAVDQVDQIITDITGALSPVLDATPKEVKDALESILGVIEGVADTDAIKVQLGASTSSITPQGKKVTVESTAAGARIGVLGLPTVNAQGAKIGAADPLSNGLIIVEVGAARAAATLNEATASSDAAASAALVTVKVRDITKPEPTYVEVSVAPGQTVTVLDGTPLESTITAADSSTDTSGGGATAAADAVRLHLLKGVEGGVKLGLGRATAAVNAKAVPAPPRVAAAQEPERTLPATGGIEFKGLALLLGLGAAGALFAARRMRSN